MQIIELIAQKVKRLDAVEITPPPEGAVVLSGKNGQGKSSVLDAIQMALGGKRFHDDEPVNRDAEEAEIVLELGEHGEEKYHVNRRWTESGNTYLDVTTADGASITSAQSFLDDLVGNLAWNPMEFVNMTASEQREALLDVVDLDVDLEDLEEQRSELYDARRIAKKERDKLEGQVESLEEQLPDPSEIPDEKVSVSELSEKRDRLLTEKRKLVSGREKINDHAEKLLGAINSIDDTLDVEDASSHEESIRSSADFFTDRTGNRIGEIQDRIGSLREKIESPEQTNDLVSRHEDLQQKREELEDKRDEVQEYQDRLDEIAETKKQAIAEADMPLDELGFSEDGVTYKGMSFGQASDSEQLRASVAIGMALNPDLRILRIDQGGLLDDESLDMLDDLAKEHGFQVWVERVEDTHDHGIRIQDGSVESDAYSETTEAEQTELA